MRGKEMPCPKCEGRGYREFEAGLIRLPCLNCEGNGVILEVENAEGDISYEISAERAGQDNQSDGGEDTSKPPKPRKRKKGKKAGA